MNSSDYRLDPNHPDGDSLSAYLDEELETEQKVEIDKHLQNCDVCSKELMFLSGSKQILRDLAPVEPPAVFMFQLKNKYIRNFALLSIGFIVLILALLLLLPALPAVSPPVNHLASLHASNPAGRDPLSQVAPLGSRK